MKTRLYRASSLRALAVMIAMSCPALAQGLVFAPVTVVNMIPAPQSGESRTDSEPNLAVNPANPQHMAASAFTPNTSGGPNAPIYVSDDGGQNWKLNPIVPFNHPDTGTGDITLRFGSTSNVLYAAVLRKYSPSDRRLYILRTGNFTSATAMDSLITPMASNCVDQPYIQAISALTEAGVSTDRVYVGYSDNCVPPGGKATVRVSLDAATAPSPNFVERRIDVRSTCGEDGPTRPAIHSDGKVYAAFFHFRMGGCATSTVTADVVVVRNDNWGDGPFDALTEPAAPPVYDGLAGIRVARGVSIPYGGILGNYQRIGGQISIAVDPSDSQRIYLAWADGTSGANYTIHVRRSADGGKTWSEDLRTVTTATTPSLAINSQGKVGFLYQKLTYDPPDKCSLKPCWETRLEKSSDDFASPPTDLLLHKALDNIPTAPEVPAGPLGEYNHLMAVGKHFYGVFSGNNTPDLENFPQGVPRYQRNVNWDVATPVDRLRATDNVTPVAVSVDPFFFRVTEPINLDRCRLFSWLCDFNPKLGQGLIKLKCLIHGCTVIDLLPKNCLVKFNCPGCPRGGMCPPYYHLYLSGLKDAWQVGLLDSEGKAVEHKLFKTRTGLVISFRPSKGKFIEGRIGSYLLAFEMEPNGKVDAEYRVKTRLARSDRHYEPTREPVSRNPR